VRDKLLESRLQRESTERDSSKIDILEIIEEPKSNARSWQGWGGNRAATRWD